MTNYKLDCNCIIFGMFSLIISFNLTFYVLLSLQRIVQEAYGITVKAVINNKNVLPVFPGISRLDLIKNFSKIQQ